MIICICKNVSETKIRLELSNGAKTIEDLKDRLDICTQCRKCRKEVKGIIEETLNDYSDCSNRS